MQTFKEGGVEKIRAKHKEGSWENFANEKEEKRIGTCEIILWKLRTNDFYSRVAMHHKTNEWTLRTSEFFGASQRVTKKSFVHTSPGMMFHTCWDFFLIDRHTPKIGSHLTARANFYINNAKSVTRRDIQSQLTTVWFLYLPTGRLKKRNKGNSYF